MTTKRDEAMARLVAADVNLRDARASIELVQSYFCDPEEDADGAVRADEIDTSFLFCHTAAIAISKAQNAMKEMDAEDFSIGEDDDEEDVDETPTEEE
jgi:hypothetical protein